MENKTPTEKSTCRCGHDRHHYMVSADATYSIWGWCTITFGITTIPIYLRFRCRRCNEVFEETDDPAILAQHA